MNYSDEEIVEQVLSGEKELFGMLIDRYQRPIYNLMHRYAHNDDEAADLTQDVFVRAFDKLWSLRADGRFFSWLYGLAINHAKDWTRKNNRRNSQLHIIEQAALDHDDGMNQNIGVEDQEDAHFLQQALLKIRDHTREILILRYRHGCSIKEVASTFNLNESAVKMRIKRGLEQLRDLIENARGERP
jgi:RNA polymerase sigma-70 factor (ECF subfamily)